VNDISIKLNRNEQVLLLCSGIIPLPPALPIPQDGLDFEKTVFFFKISAKMKELCH